jgi:hypothetical protein
MLAPIGANSYNLFIDIYAKSINNSLGKCVSLSFWYILNTSFISGASIPMGLTYSCSLLDKFSITKPSPSTPLSTLKCVTKIVFCVVFLHTIIFNH